MFRFRKKRVVENESPLVMPPFDSSGFEDLINYTKTYSGVDLNPKKDILKRRFTNFCEQNEIKSFFKLLDSVQYDKSLRQKLINLLTVNETYFLREKIQLDNAILFLKKMGGNSRILSAPCASGEEVYSLFIMAIELGVNPHNIEITGVDINSNTIKEAQDGVFNERSLHRASPKQKSDYFYKEGDKYRIKSSLFGKFRFHTYNIFDKEFLQFEPFDVIFSRNMMIYFDEKHKYKTIEIFHKLLKPHGRLYAGHADLVPKSSLFKKITEGKLTFYEKI